MDTTSDDTIRAAFEAQTDAASYERFDNTAPEWLRGQYKNGSTQWRWDAYRAGYEHAIEDAAREFLSELDAMFEQFTTAGA